MTGSLEIIEDFKTFEGLREEWNLIVSENEFQTVFQTHEFYNAWWKAFGNGKQLHIMVQRNKYGNINLIAPMYHNAQPLKKLFLMGDLRGDYNHLIFNHNSPQALGLFMKYLENSENWDSILWRKLPIEGPKLEKYFPGLIRHHDTLWRKMLAWLKWGHPLVYGNSQRTHPYTSAARLAELEKYLDKKSVRQRVARLNKTGALSFRTLSTSEEISQYFPAYMELHSKRCQYRKQKVFFAEEANRKYFAELISKMAPKNWIRFDLVFLDDTLLAAHFGFDYAQTSYVYKSCYDPDYAKFGPGKILRGYVFQRAARSGQTSVDLLNGLEEYKNEFFTGIRETRSYLLIKSRWNKLRRHF